MCRFVTVRLQYVALLSRAVRTPVFRKICCLHFTAEECVHYGMGSEPVDLRVKQMVNIT